MFDAWISRLVAAGLHSHLNRMEHRLMSANDQIVAALQDLKADLATGLTDLEQAVTDAVASQDPTAALALIADMKASVDAADATTKPAAPAPTDPSDPTAP